MTKRITISLPDDLADEAQESGNASGYIADALREQRRIRDGMAALERLWGPGWQDGITDADRERANRLFDSARDVA
ncbi:hypothetical protein ABZV14_42425 [Streptosporangium canum]|jgi:hypothetical protein|uniref:Uncharacterized protein n=2 Tax=Streptosporangium TaxID=2000 RepID=A0A1I4C7T9_9ACTN|nr:MULTISPECIES: hypothetical protein [Streptosporangium]OUC91896.1 hypothetical protein CA984_32005 [Streptosporangium minutum]SFK76853.1 hypothetical protein SAMN05216275_134104 [Streptosporangium canum]